MPDLLPRLRSVAALYIGSDHPNLDAAAVSLGVEVRDWMKDEAASAKEGVMRDERLAESGVFLAATSAEVGREYARCMTFAASALTNELRDASSVPEGRVTDHDYERLRAELRNRGVKWDGDAVLAAVRLIDQLRNERDGAKAAADRLRAGITDLADGLTFASGGYVHGTVQDGYRHVADRLRALVADTTNPAETAEPTNDYAAAYRRNRGGHDA